MINNRNKSAVKDMKVWCPAISYGPDNQVYSPFSSMLASLPPTGIPQKSIKHDPLRSPLRSLSSSVDERRSKDLHHLRRWSRHRGVCGRQPTMGQRARLRPTKRGVVTRRPTVSSEVSGCLREVGGLVNILPP